MPRLRPTSPAFLLILAVVPAIVALLRLWTDGDRASFIAGLLAIPLPLLLLAIRRIVWRAEALPRTGEELTRAHGEFGLLAFYATYMLLWVHVAYLLWPGEDAGVIGELPLAARIAMVGVAVFMWLVVLYAGRAILQLDQASALVGGDGEGG